MIYVIMQAERADQEGRRHEDGSPQGQDPSIDEAWFTTAIPRGACPKIKSRLANRTLFVRTRSYTHGVKIISLAQQQFVIRRYMCVREDCRQETLPFAIANIRPNPWLPLSIWDCQAIKKVFLKAMQPLQAIDQHIATFSHCWPRTRMTPLISEIASEIPSRPHRNDEPSFLTQIPYYWAMPRRNWNAHYEPRSPRVLLVSNRWLDQVFFPARNEDINRILVGAGCQNLTWHSDAGI
ncbi:hypothetical protein AO259_12690 [Pseudomonas sp. ICMP 564]|nr:hypothetical protein AO259_12690 [Pseudomonas sp. ICMP 564]